MKPEPLKPSPHGFGPALCDILNEQAGLEPEFADPKVHQKAFEEWSAQVRAANQRVIEFLKREKL